MLYALLVALPVVFAASGRGNNGDYKAKARKNVNPATTVACVLETDKSGEYYQSCQEQTKTCKKGEPCVIQCLGRTDRCAGDEHMDCKPCYGTTFIGADSQDLTFTCEGDSACQNVKIQCPEHAECNVRLSGGTGAAQFGMKGAVIIGAQKGALTVENNQARSGMEDAQITCPTNDHCSITASNAYGTTSLDAYKGAVIDGSAASHLSIDTEEADRPLQNADVFCPPRIKMPACEINVVGGQAMMMGMHVHVDESIEDVKLNCQFDSDAAIECYGDDSDTYDDEGNAMWKVPYQPTLECGVEYGSDNSWNKGAGYENDFLEGFNFDCLLVLDAESGSDDFSCVDFEGESVCAIPEHAGGFCNYVGEEKVGDREGSSCDRYVDAESCDAVYDCVWDAYSPNSMSAMMAAAKVTMSNALEGNGSNTLYLALSLVLFGSSAAVYYACMNRKQMSEVERLTFEDDGVVFA